MLVLKETIVESFSTATSSAPFCAFRSEESVTVIIRVKNTGSDADSNGPIEITLKKNLLDLKAQENVGAGEAITFFMIPDVKRIEINGIGQIPVPLRKGEYRIKVFQDDASSAGIPAAAVPNP